MKKVWLLLLVLMCFTLISCNDSTENGNGDVTTIKFVCNAGYVAEFEERIAEFETLHPEINVEIQGIAASSWGEMLNTISLDRLLIRYLPVFRLLVFLQILYLQIKYQQR